MVAQDPTVSRSRTPDGLPGRRSRPVSSPTVPELGPLRRALPLDGVRPPEVAGLGRADTVRVPLDARHVPTRPGSKSPETGRDEPGEVSYCKGDVWSFNNVSAHGSRAAGASFASGLLMRTR